MVAFPWVRKVRPLLGISSLSLLAAGCGSSRAGQQAARRAPDWEHVALRTDTLRVVDAVHQRPIPLATYAPLTGPSCPPQLKLALFSPGYGNANTAYSFLAKNLVAHGYYVASLQQDLPSDAPMPTTGNPAEVRRPYWERGVQNLVAVVQQLRRTHPELDCRHVLLLGHSNGDISALFTQKYPFLVQYLITLDNRRMPLPRTRRPRVLSLRSSDQPADAGVLPTPAEQAQLGMTLVQLPTTRHNAMWDGAALTQQQEINSLISKFLAK